MASCADCCGKALLVIINIFVIILGVLFLIVGLFLKFGLSRVLEMLGLNMETLVSSLKSTNEALGGSLSSSPSLADMVSELSSTLEVAIAVFITLGVFMLVVAILGCCGACCSFRVLLALYAAVLLLIFVASVIVLALWVNKSVDDKIFGSLEDALKTKYAGPLALNKESLLLNGLMFLLQCCGINTYEEFTKAASWDRNYVVSVNGYNVTLTAKVPLSCCKIGFTSFTSVDINCTFAPTSVNSNIDTSCREAIDKQTDAYSTEVYGVYSAILAFEVICAAIAICLVVRMTNAKKNRVRPSQNDTSTFEMRTTGYPRHHP